MKIICLSKRRPLNRDLWERPYGRFYHLAKGLSDLGYDVYFCLLNYENEKEFSKSRDGIAWISVNLFPLPWRYYLTVKALAEDVGADWVLGFSDIYYGVVAQKIAASVGCKSLIDAYDNYESYVPWLKPLHYLWRKSLASCDEITAAGPALNRLMSKDRSEPGHIVEMAADPVFSPGDKQSARKKLGLDSNKKIVLYAGSLHENRGIALLYELIENCKIENVEWVLSGRINDSKKLPANCNWLGYIDDDLVVELFRSADLIISINKDSEFGNYSYPVKLYEAISTGVPVLAIKTDSTSFVLRNIPEGLVDSRNSKDILDYISSILQRPFFVSSTSSWEKGVTRLNSIILEKDN